MRKLILIVLLCVVAFYIIDHSFVVITTGVALGALAVVGMVLYVADTIRRG